MSEQLLQVKNLVVNVEDTEILHGIDLEINRGETHVLMGPNGAGTDEKAPPFRAGGADGRDFSVRRAWCGKAECSVF